MRPLAIAAAALALAPATGGAQSNDGCPSSRWVTEDQLDGVRFVRRKGVEIIRSGQICRRGVRPLRVRVKGTPELLHVRADRVLFSDASEDADDLRLADLRGRTVRSVASLSDSAATETWLAPGGRVFFVDDDTHVILYERGRTELLGAMRFNAGRLTARGSGSTEVVRYGDRTIRVAARRAHLRRCFPQPGTEVFRHEYGEGFAARRGAALLACSENVPRGFEVSPSCPRALPSFDGRWVSFRCPGGRVGVADTADARVVIAITVPMPPSGLDATHGPAGALAWVSGAPRPGDPPRVLNLFVPGSAAPIVLDAPEHEVRLTRHWAGRTLTWVRRTRPGGPVESRSYTLP